MVNLRINYDGIFHELLILYIMKKILFFMMILGVVVTACKKEKNPNVSLEGNQWITEEFEPYGDFPSGRYLFDFGAKSGAGKMTSVIVVTESNSLFEEGDLILLSRSNYTYDASTGVISNGGEGVRVEYLTPKKIQFCSTEDDSQLMVLSLVEGKQYQIKDAVIFQPEMEEFKITPSNEADWAGGTITFMSNRIVTSLTYDVLTEGLTLQEDLCKTTLSDNTLTLGQYVGDGGTLTDCQIMITASDEEGNETSCIVTSKAWKPAVYTEDKGAYTQYDLSNGWSRGQDCWLGALCAEGEIRYDGEADTFGGISYQVPDFMKAYGNNDNKVCHEMPSTNGSGTIIYTYGELSYELPIEINR